MTKNPTDAEIRSIVSSMRIEGFGSTYESVKASLTEFYEDYDQTKMDELVIAVNKPGADKMVLTDAYIKDFEAKEFKESSIKLF